MPERQSVPHRLLGDEDPRRRNDTEQGDPFAILDEIHARNADRDPDEAEQDVAEEIAAMREEQRRQRAFRRRA
jgi:hypothetical protein